ncbi:MAG: hypothetical protein H8D67_30950 [Deltaproteobacteria bacterium]|nr:hypothetical protein [Deltaproteobacteria bacterium]
MKNNVERIINRLPDWQKDQIYNEAAQSAFEKTNGMDKLVLNSCSQQLQKIDGIGEVYALVILAALGRLLDEEGWPDGN